MPNPTNLYEYYTSKGQQLPSIQERGVLYSQQGLGTGYTGTAEQNTALLQKLSVGDISGTMTIPPVGTTPTTPTPPLAGGTPETTGGQTGMGTTDPMRFYTIMDQMSQKLNKNQELVDMRNKVFTHLYDRPLTDEERGALTPELQHAIETNDFNLINFHVRKINDEIKGRKDTLDQSIEFLSRGYELQQQQIESQRERAESILMSGLEKYGGDILNIYSPEQIEQLRNMGYDIAGIAGLPSVEEIKAGLKGGIGTIPGQTISYEQLSPTAKLVVDGTFKLSDITPTQKQAIASELVAYGFTYAMAQADQQNVSYIKNQLMGGGEITSDESVLGSWKKIPDQYKGLIQGAWGELIGKKISPEVARFKASQGIVGMQLTRLYEKGRISDQDRIFYLSLMPNLYMNEAAAVAGANELVRLLQEKLTNQVNELEGLGATQNDWEYIPE